MKPANTEFSRWRRERRFTQKQAAEALGKCEMQIRRLDRGATYDGRPMKPSRSLRLLMAFVAEHGVQHRPWPE